LLFSKSRRGAGSEAFSCVHSGHPLTKKGDGAGGCETRRSNCASVVPCDKQRRRGATVGGDMPFRHPRLAVSIFGVISTRETQQFINPDNDFSVINISGRGTHRHLRHFCQHIRVKELSSASLTSPLLIFWSEAIAITIFERILQAPAKRGWR
jgi:hypothetical protein